MIFGQAFGCWSWLLNSHVGRATKCFYRTHAAFRIARQTNRRAEIHQRGVETPGVLFRHERAGGSPQRLAILNIERARENACGVRFDDWK
ncbi:MAG: hypothetical protein QOG48_2138 [Verrucomicrobiota bacterium]